MLNDFLRHILTICAAVGDHDGFVQLPMQTERDRARLSLHQVGPNAQSALVEVPVMRLDTFLASRDIVAIQLLKIDVEGYELEVLNGIGECLTSCSNIVPELLDATSADKNRAVVDLLRAAGFTLNDVRGEPWQWGMPLPKRNLWAARH